MTADNDDNANGVVKDPPTPIRRNSNTDAPLTSLEPPKLNSDMNGESDDGMTTPRSTTEAATSFDSTPTPDGAGGNEFIDSLHETSIQSESPAAKSLRASAEVHVGTTAKLARKMHVEKIRKVLKKATKRGIGNKRGKPPRIPPNRAGSGEEEEGMYIVEEGDEESSESEDESDDDDDEPTHSGEMDSGRDAPTKHVAFIVEEDNSKYDIHKIPNEVLTATMETGRKRKFDLSSQI